MTIALMVARWHTVGYERINKHWWRSRNKIYIARRCVATSCACYTRYNLRDTQWSGSRRSLLHDASTTTTTTTTCFFSKPLSKDRDTDEKDEVQST